MNSTQGRFFAVPVASPNTPSSVVTWQVGRSPQEGVTPCHLGKDIGGTPATRPSLWSKRSQTVAKGGRLCEGSESGG